MTTYTSKASGNWSSSSTWNPTGVPGNGDAVEINHAVVVDVNTTVGQSLASMQYNASAPYGNAITVRNSGASLTIASGVTLTVRGDVVAFAKPITINAGGVLSFDSTQSSDPANTYYVLDMQNSYNTFGGYLILNGTAGNRATVQTVPGCMPARMTPGYKPIGQATHNYGARDCGIIQGTYGRFYRMGDASNWGFQCWLTAGDGASSQPAYQYYLRNVEFDTCGQWNQYVGMDSKSYLEMRNVTWKNSVNQICMSIGSSGSIATGGRRTITTCVFDTQLSIAGANDFTIDGCIFKDTYGLNGANNLTVKNCLIANISHVNSSGDITTYASSGAKAVTQPMGAWSMLFDNNYVVFNNPWYGHPHILIWTTSAGNCTVSNNLVEFTGSDPNGDFVFQQPPSSGNRASNQLTITNNIILPNSGASYPFPGGAYHSQSATLITDEGGSLGTWGLNIDHNTALSDVTGQGALAFNEASTGGPGEIQSCRSNIVWNPSSNLVSGNPIHSGDGAGVPHSVAAWNENSNPATDLDQVTAANLDYNAKYNMATANVSIGGVSTATVGYKNFNFSGTAAPGQHDRVADPQFLDPYRNCAKFDSVANGSGSGTATNCIAEMAKINDDSGYNTAYTVSALVNYVRAGYQPTNPILFYSAHDGTAIGAVNVNAPISVSSTFLA